MGTSRKLAEYTVDMIEAEIKSKISSALSDVRTDRADASVSTEVPKDYFRYLFPKNYRTPAIFTIMHGMSMQNVRGANHISSVAKVVVSVLVEDRLKESLVKKSFRYQAALHEILHETSLVSVDQAVKLVIKVENIYFSQEASDTKDASAPQSVFRKEVALELAVEHYENL